MAHDTGWIEIIVLMPVALGTDPASERQIHAHALTEQALQDGTKQLIQTQLPDLGHEQVGRR